MTRNRVPSPVPTKAGIGGTREAEVGESDSHWTLPQLKKKGGGAKGKQTEKGSTRNLKKQSPV